MALYGALELGGTKTLVAVGTAPADLTEPLRIPTTDPEPTLTAAIEHLARHRVDSVGVASFGPVELRPGHKSYGAVTTTPKPGWPMTDVLGIVSTGLDVPAAIDTDVNGAAIGEGKWGAAAGLTDFVYVTVGTGVGAGAVIDGKPLIAQGHPEMGHMTVVPAEGDDYAGRCPFHGGCLEGMASGPAIEDRFGPVGMRADDRPRDLAAHYVAQGARNIVYALAPQRVIIGGGVSAMAGFHRRVRQELAEQLNGYPPITETGSDDFIAPPGLGDLSGLAGALLLARAAL